MATEFYLSVSLSYLKQSVTCRKILRHGAGGFTSRPKEVMLQIFIALKILSLSAGFEPANLRRNELHANHLTTENDFTLKRAGFLMF
jgi:hypothetical protein